MEKNSKKLILEDGQEYYGTSFGADKNKVCELVFNTSMVGYQEILSDPSYTYQAVVMTYPLIGNYGMADDDYECEKPTIGALIVREYNNEPSNFRSSKTLADVMQEYGIPGISGIDTRKLARSIRDYGSRKMLLTDSSTSLEEGLAILRQTDLRHDAVAKVSRKKVVFYPVELFLKEMRLTSDGCEQPMTKREQSKQQTDLAAIVRKKQVSHIVAIDCGMKQNIIRSLNQKGCDVTVVPWNTKADEIRKLNPDGVFISNGPGDPTDVPSTIETVKALLGKCPMFGICLGHQIISLAYGAKTYKLKFGHRGGNHPVKNLLTGKIEITSQNHSYAVDAESLHATRLEATHINLLDHTIEGVRCEADRVFSVQYHPESAPGPQDSSYLFDQFLELIKLSEP